MENRGKLTAADMIIGNGDRVENTNMGKIMFNDDGQIAAIDSAAIDSAAILSSFDQMVRAARCAAI